MSDATPTSSAPKKVLLFAPFGAWGVHHQVDAVVGAALALRGAEVTALVCDGLFEECPLAGRPARAEACASCAQSSANLFRAFGLPHVQLRALLTPDEIRTVRAWADALAHEALDDAKFQGLPIGEWAAHSVHGFLLTGRLDPARADWVRFHRKMLASAALVHVALTRVLAGERFDHLLCYNALHAPYRAAFEAARAHDVDCLVHERGYVGGWTLLENGTFYTTAARTAAWEQWQHVPLDERECRQVHDFFFARETGAPVAGNPGFYGPAGGFSHDGRGLRASLRIPDGVPLVGLFTTSDWEAANKRGHVRMPFPSQLDWIRRTAEVAHARGAYLIVRHHPNMFQKGYDAAAFFEELMHDAGTLPPNVRMLMPYERITSYAVLQHVDVAVTYMSTIGTEALLRGIPTLCVTDFLHAGAGPRFIESTDGYEQALVAAMAGQAKPTWDELRRAYRFCHLLYLRLNRDFASFEAGADGTMSLKISSLAELAPGRDATLDLVCDHVLRGTSLNPPVPGTRDDGAAELAFVREIEDKHRRVRESVRAAPPPGATGVTTDVAVLHAASGSRASRLVDSLSRARHERLRVATLPLSSGDRPMLLLDGLLRALSSRPESIVHVVGDDVAVDESVHATAADALAADPALEAVVFGTWLLRTNGTIADELFTSRKPAAAWSTEVAHAPAIADPLRVLSLAVFRKAALERWLSDPAAFAMPTRAALAQALWTRLFSDDPAVLRIPGPFFAWPPDREALLAYLQQLPYPAATDEAARALAAYRRLDPTDVEVNALAEALAHDAPALRRTGT